MLVENPDALKSWLTEKLKPLCDADPVALAKYVLALVKKEKPLPQLQANMENSLDVFLQKETKSFVKSLLEALQDKSYIGEAKEEDEEEEMLSDSRVASPVRVEEVPALEEPKPLLSIKIKEEKLEVERPKEQVVEVKKERVELNDRSDRDRKRPSERPSRRNRHRSPSPTSRRSRSRSRSWEGRRRSRSRERARRGRDRKASPRRRDSSRDRRSWSKSPVRNRSHSPPVGKHRGRNYRSKSKSPLAMVKKSEPNSGANTPTQDSNHGDVDMRLTTSSQSIQSVVVTPTKKLASVVAAAPQAASAAPTVYKTRCRDFDEQGYCMRGDLCQFDHGADPVIVDNMPGLSYTPQEYNPDAPGMPWFRPPFRGRGGAGRGSVLRAPFIPPQRELISVPVTDNASAKTVFEPSESTSYETDLSETGPPPSKKLHLAGQQFDYKRLGPRKHFPANCSLELKKVPRGLNNITHLNDHFAKFGKIVNIQVCFEGDPEAAIVTFSTHAEANAAIKSTEAVLNNRFIKMFWHGKKQAGFESKHENVPPVTRMSVRDRLGVPSNKVLNLIQQKAKSEVEVNANAAGNDKPDSNRNVYIPTAKKVDPALQENSKALAAAAIIKNQEIMLAKETLKKKQEEKRKEALKMTANLRKRKQELLEMQLTQQKVLIERLEKARSAMKPAEQKELLETIKSLQESIETIRKDLAPHSVTAAAAIPAPKPKPVPQARKTKEEVQKEILDAELDLITHQQEGKDSLELKQKVAELKKEASTLSLLKPVVAAPVPIRRGGLRGRGRGRGLYRGRGARGAMRGGLTRLDHRPTKLLVSGHESDEWEEVVAHFTQFGEIKESVPDHQTPALELTFRTRKDAEVALVQGKQFKDRTLSVTWVAQVAPQAAAAPTEIATAEVEDDGQNQENEKVTEGDLEVEASLELDEEELDAEEEDEEERSWRR
ncbi:RNA-binding protein 26 isoform X2 [Neocloeon triangulifer]|uniref:RNA-binding protein 26 isoform X2 n=1 Tax=Neocloeon triangulifer TaxID=2078957 RepID=UPI00286EE323|nr:RNA-binding protein 26 isoform X2 [Neocloeon triangulifer]